MVSKINWLTTQVAPGSLVLQQWLLANGISYSLAHKYLHSGWLKKFSTGVYYRPDTLSEQKPSWAHAVDALHRQAGVALRLAGLSSLAEQGLAHYVSMDTSTSWLGVESQKALPKWFRGFPDHNWVYCHTGKLNLVADKDLSYVNVNNLSLPASSPELAAYEVVDAIGKKISFEHAAELFQGLVNLSPRKVQDLLSRSRAVRTNRLFLFLSHYSSHAWANHLDESQIAFGAGKRQVIANGHYDSRYQITVPKQFADGNSDG